jgi:hypothetical protein
MAGSNAAAGGGGGMYNTTGKPEPGCAINGKLAAFPDPDPIILEIGNVAEVRALPLRVEVMCMWKGFSSF